LLEGYLARERMVQCNTRLVKKIATAWLLRDNSINKKASSHNFGFGRTESCAQASWDEIVQEGFVGLHKAVDKYDPTIGLRFSTYATHWVTSYIRSCVLGAKTGCLKVPEKLHLLKAKYDELVRDHKKNNKPPP